MTSGDVTLASIMERREAPLYHIGPKRDLALFEEIEALGKEAGILKGTARFEDYADPSFVRDEASIQPYDWEGPE